MARFVYDFFPSSQSALRYRWKDIHIMLEHSLLRAQLRFVADFCHLFYMPEMKWSQQADPAIGVCGFKAHLLPGRLVDRMNRLQQLLQDFDTHFAAAVKVASPTHATRFKAEGLAFLQKFYDTVEKHAENWLTPPLVLVALGDPAHERYVALAVVDAAQSRQQTSPTAVTRRITTPKVKEHVLATDKTLFEQLQAFSLGRDLEALPELLQWCRVHAYSLRHHNQQVESFFNIMDDLGDLGGPAMKHGTLDARMKALANTVLADRPDNKRDATGRKAQFHWTKNILTGIAERVVEQGALYTPEVLQKAAAAPGLRANLDHASRLADDAAHAQPARRAQYSEDAQANSLEA